MQSDCSEVEIRVGRRRRDAGVGVGQQRTERRARLHPCVPALRRLVFAPRHVTQVIDRREVRGGREVRVGEPLAREPVARLHEPADVGQMIADIAQRRTDRVGIGRAAAVRLAHLALEHALGGEGAADLGEELVAEPRHQPPHLDPRMQLARQEAVLAELRNHASRRGIRRSCAPPESAGILPRPAPAAWRPGSSPGTRDGAPTAALRPAGAQARARRARAARSASAGRSRDETASA